MVHAAVTSSEEKKKPNQKETRKEQLSHIEEKEGQLECEANKDTNAQDAPDDSTLSPDTKKFLEFAETHRTVLNQILRQSTTHLADGPFCVLVDHTRVLDFDIKRRYFRTELERLDEGIRREDLAVHVRRDAVFEESFRELHRFVLIFEFSRVKRYLRKGVITTEFLQAKCRRMEEPILHRLRRRGGSGRWRAFEGVVRDRKYFQTSFLCCGQVCDHLAGNLQPELRTLQEQSRRQGKLKRT